MCIRDSYCGARLVVMGMAYNTQNVTEEEAPKHWKDLLNETCLLYTSRCV